jgi:hypothetical protein
MHKCGNDGNKRQIVYPVRRLLAYPEMCRFKRLTSWAIVLFFSHSAVSKTIYVTNNQPFSVRLPVEIRDVWLAGNGWLAGEQPVQADGGNMMLVADVPASSAKSVELRAGQNPNAVPSITAEPTEAGLSVSQGQVKLGTFSWDILIEPVKKKTDEPDSAQVSNRDFNSKFAALPIHFAKVNNGPVFDDWAAETVKEGLRLWLRVRCFHEGFLDITARLTNESVERTNNVYAAAICRWEQNGQSGRSFCYDNHIAPLGENARSSFREGEGRHLAIQRGVDWVCTSFGNGDGARAGLSPHETKTEARTGLSTLHSAQVDCSVAWLNDFASSFTVKAEATTKTPAHFTGANASLLGREVQTAGNRVYFITEIARSSVRSFRDRLKENILMPRGESVSFSSRLVFGDATLDDRRADELFIAWNSFNEQTTIPSGKALSFGVPAVRFGTSYFPYSTLGENFDAHKLPGMDRESFWPLAADTVNQWKLFADDIRRDLRIAKAMGFQLIRLHHLELLAPIKKITRQEYLDFIFTELRHLKLKALLDVYTSPTQMTELLKRYGDAVDGVEVENETLIWGIPLDRPKEWTELYAAIKKAAPHVRVHFTSYNNTGMFDRLSELGVPFDRVCLHSYIDTLDAMPSARGYSLALSNYANKVGKPPLITEWNWRGLTRMTEQARAKIYPQIIEGAIGTRGIPDFYQFQFNETLCPNPRVGRGNILRHYELLHLSRRPKVEAVTLMEIIRKYSASSDALRQLSVSSPIEYYSERRGGAAEMSIQNNGATVRRLRVSVESPKNLDVRLRSPAQLELRPGQSTNVQFSIRIPEKEPGFYHGFTRIESGDGLLR